MRRMLGWCVHLFWQFVPAILAFDLLYLYARGAWIEPITWIRTYELIGLCVITALSLVIAGRTIHAFWK